MGKIKCLALSLLFASVLVSCAGLDIRPVAKPMAAAPVPEYKVGDKFVFTVAIVDDAQEVVAVDDKTVTIKSAMFGTRAQYKDFSTPESWTGGITQAYWTRPAQILTGLFPLKIGNRVSGSGAFAYNSRGSYARTCTVDAQVRVTVPAGSFDTYQIECEMKYTYPNGSEAQSDRIWYSPDINHWVAIIRHGRMFVLRSYDKK